VGRSVATIGMCLLVLASPLAARADPIPHQVLGNAADMHTLIHLSSALCDPANGDPFKPKDPHFFCRYSIRGTYMDESSDDFLGMGRVSGRFTFDTGTWTEKSPGYGCFAVHKGVVKFTTFDGGRLRTRISRYASRICQTFDGVTVNGPDRAIRFVMKATPGGCIPPYCGVSGKLVWVSTGVFDEQAPQGIVRYLDSATFHGTLTCSRGGSTPTRRSRTAARRRTATW
jgi:hypothetical protein